MLQDAQIVGEDKRLIKKFLIVPTKNFVKQVAEICKKFNDKLEIISTEDQTPNNGYTLSNKKIINEGFNFLYNIEDSIKEMINFGKKRN